MAKKPTRPAAKKTAQPAAAKPQQKSVPDTGWLKLGLAVLAITALCFLPTLRYEYVNWDDPKNITENENLLLVGKGQSWGTTVRNIFDIEKGNVIGNYNPLPILTFAVEKSLNKGEFSPQMSHGLNVLFHLLTVFLVMKLLWGMGIGRWGVVAGGLLFGIHPMRVESVAWATERKDVLFAFFFFAALVAYVRWMGMTRRAEVYHLDTSKGNSTVVYVGMVLLALLSCFSKVQAVTLPLSMLALDFWFRRPLNAKLLLEKTPFWALSLVFGLLNMYTLKVQGSTDDTVTNFNFIDRLCIGAYSFCTYVYKSVVPHPMSPLYAYPKQLPWTVYAAPIGFFAAVAAVWWAWKKGHRVWVFGAAFFFFNVMFLLQILAAGQGFLADRFTYVAYFGFFAVAAYYLNQYASREQTRNASLAVLAIVGAVYTFWSMRQSAIWKDGYTLWTHVMSLDEGREEKSTLPYWNRGQFLRNERGDYDAALRDYTRAVEMEPTNPELLNSRGKTYFDMSASGKYKGQEKALLEKALKDYTQALASPRITKKTKSEALSNRGAAHGMLNMYEQSVRDITESIELDPTNKNAYANRSIAYLNTGQYEKALADYQSYLKFDPNNYNFWYESGMVQRVMKKNDDAIRSLDRALQLNPKMGIAYLERARAKAQKGDFAAARSDYQQARQLGASPDKLDEQYINSGN